MLYVVILIVAVAAIAFFVMKKRGEANTSTQKPAAKKPVAPSSSTPAQAPVETKKAFTPLTPEIRNKIEALIKEQNYFAAEAQINQALNRDNTQHELYLLLLDIHIAQKDEFATDQLINHLKSLQLTDILAQATEKQKEFQSQETSYEPQPSTSVVEKEDAPLAFEPATKVHVSDNTAFDQLHKPTAPQAVEEKKEDLAPLDFNFSSSTKTADAEPIIVEQKVEAPVSTTAAPLNFDDLSLSPNTAEKAEPAKEEPAALSFDDLSFSPNTTEKVEPVKEEPAPLDFNFSLEPTTEVTKEAVAEPVQAEEKALEPSLDFSFTELNAEPATKVEAEPTIELTLDTPTAETSESPIELEFDTPITETTKTVIEPKAIEEINLDFDFTAPIKTTETNFDVAQVAPSAAVDTTDPLAQSFPELVEVNEITLNLDLAQQYIDLGAYEAARQLLSEKDADYSTEQRQRADELRNQIA